MKTKSVFLYSALALGAKLLCAQPVLTPSPPGTVSTAPKIGPRIQFQTLVYDFGKVKSGEVAKYEFVFTNTGDAVLTLTDVKPACGCTTAGEWSRSVEPGKTGAIPLQFNSANFSGQVLKTANVTSNDKSQPSVGLQLKGTVWKPIDVQPTFAVLTIPPEAQSNVTTRVHIINNMEDPITLSKPESNNKAFTADLKTKIAGKDFEVVISAVPPLLSVQGQITLKTSSTNMPVITITAFANVQQAIVVQPPQVMLSSGPLPAKQTVIVTIQNNSSNPLTLSEPLIDAKGVELHIAETNPGRLFTASLTFPEGFKLGQGQKVEFTVKTSNARQPLIKVPIMQMPKPVAVSAAPPPLVH